MDVPTVRQLCSRPSAEQTRALLDELELHPHLARGRSRVNNRRQSDKLWQDMTARLNSLPGCQKSNKQWQKFWADKKSSVKKQVAVKQAEGLSVSAAAFGNTEVRIIHLIEKGDVDDDEEDPQSPVTMLENLGEYTMSDEDENFNNSLLEMPTESDMILEVKKEPKASRSTYPRTRNSELRRLRLLKPKAESSNKTLNSNKLLKKLFQIQQQRTEFEDRIATSLASIAASMKRQEEATKKLTTLLLEAIPRSNQKKIFSRTQTPRPSSKQVEALLDELETNRYLANGMLKKKSTPLWNSLAARLNRIEGCEKTPRQWMKYWSDKKLSVKRLIEAVELAEDNNDPNILSTLTDIEHRVIALSQNTHFDEPNIDYEAPGSPMEAEYLENDEYLSDENDDIILAELKNPLNNVGLDLKDFQIKQEPCTMKQSLREEQKLKPQSKKKRSQQLTPNQMWHRLVTMEERRLNVQESIMNSLNDIEGCMKRQEDATKELARLLIKVIR